MLRVKEPEALEPPQVAPRPLRPAGVPEGSIPDTARRGEPQGPPPQPRGRLGPEPFLRARAPTIVYLGDGVDLFQESAAIFQS